MNIVLVSAFLSTMLAAMFGWADDAVLAAEGHAPAWLRGERYSLPGHIVSGAAMLPAAWAGAAEQVYFSW
jgi:hypothetical protein